MSHTWKIVRDPITEDGLRKHNEAQAKKMGLQPLTAQTLKDNIGSEYLTAREFKRIWNWIALPAEAEPDNSYGQYFIKFIRAQHVA